MGFSKPPKSRTPFWSDAHQVSGLQFTNNQYTACTTTALWQHKILVTQCSIPDEGCELHARIVLYFGEMLHFHLLVFTLEGTCIDGNYSN